MDVKARSRHTASRIGYEVLSGITCVETRLAAEIVNVALEVAHHTAHPPKDLEQCTRIPMKEIIHPCSSRVIRSIFGISPTDSVHDSALF